MRVQLVSAFLTAVAAVLLAPPSCAQVVPPQPLGPAGDAAASAGTAAPTSVDEEAEGEEVAFPNLDLYLPEGELDLRLNRLVRKAFFEGQVRYNFVKGDITAFLRYRYYGYRRTYQLGFFDAIDFRSVEQLNNDFERTRGGLMLMQWPFDYHSRSFLLTEVDRITSNKPEFLFSTNRTNTFVRVGYQLGTPDDQRSNAIVGERRAQVEELFTAHREIGPHGAGVTGAATWGFDYLGGDFSYVKLELEGLKRLDLFGDTFLVSRIHAGSFPLKKRLRPEPVVFPGDVYAIPVAELFKLDGRSRLKGLSETTRGTEEIHSTAELFVPWFLRERRRALGIEWNSVYGVLYGGVGTIGFDRNIYTDLGSYVADSGVGFEAAIHVHGYPLFLSGIVAKAWDGQSTPQLHLSVKSYH